ncbi:MAG TPA: cytochrome oxidase subunit III [Polyangia bacterium]|nr:cytochrome oxidase subunit III [Polyangia bacterium]
MNAPAVTARRDADTAVGLLVFLGATAMLFAALLLAYAILRAQAPQWPPAGSQPLPRGAAGANTLVLVAASATLWRARRRAGWAWRAAAGALGAGFLAGQIVLWRHMVATGLGPRGQMPGQIFLALSALHALHVAGGLAVLALSRRVQLVSLYWDFVLTVWVVLYVAVCWL